MTPDDMSNQQLFNGLLQVLGTITDKMLVKEDLDDFESRLRADMATKDDIAAITTRIDKLDTRIDSIDARIDGIEGRMATKDDLERFATKDDLQASEQRIVAKLGARIDSARRASTAHHFETRKMIGDLYRQQTYDD